MDCHHVGGIAHEDFLSLCHLQHTVESLGNFSIQPGEHLFLRPVKIHVVLDAFEVGGGYAASIAQKVGDKEDVIALNDFVGFWGSWPVGALGYHADAAAYPFD